MRGAAPDVAMLGKCRNCANTLMADRHADSGEVNTFKTVLQYMSSCAPQTIDWTES